MTNHEAIQAAKKIIENFIAGAKENTAGFIGNDGSFYACDFDMDEALTLLQSVDDGWRPIESAPRDGTWIILCGGETTEDNYSNEDVSKGRPVIAFYGGNDYAGNEIEYWSFCYWDGEWRTEYINPTGWMPISFLPPPPEKEGE